MAGQQSPGPLIGESHSLFTREGFVGLWCTIASMPIRYGFLTPRGASGEFNNFSIQFNFLQDKTDDRTVGIRSTALLFGDHSRTVLSGLSASSVALIGYSGYLNAQGPLFYAGVGLAAAQLARVLFRTDFDSRPSCWRGFVGCGWAGFWIWMGAFADFFCLGTGIW